jgi:hypothetical protein
MILITFSNNLCPFYCSLRLGADDDPNNQSLIHEFWTVGLGKFSHGILEQMNARMNGKMIDIESPTALQNTYMQIAEVCPTD